MIPGPKKSTFLCERSRKGKEREWTGPTGLVHGLKKPSLDRHMMESKSGCL